MYKKQLQRDDDGNLIMNEENILMICEKEGLYEYPELNSKLYLHFKGTYQEYLAFRKIGGLDSFINVKTLWLENNFITKIEGLECLQKLTHLFLQNNLITKIEGLSENLDLHTLNLSSNSLRKVENLYKLQKLSTLDLSNNKFKSVSDIWELELNKSVCTLDLQNNLLQYEGEYDDDPLLCVFVKMPNLKCLYLQRNEYLRSINNYRKVQQHLFKYYLSNLPNLTYLDTQPVFPNERRIVDAWGKEGKEGEKIERESNNQLIVEIQSEENAKKKEYRDEVKKQLPVYLQKKISIFQKQINSIQEEISEMEQLKQQHIVLGSQQIEVIFLEESIQQKINQITEITELLNNMRVRQIRQDSQMDLSQSFIQLVQQSTQETFSSVKLDEID